MSNSNDILVNLEKYILSDEFITKHFYNLPYLSNNIIINKSTFNYQNNNSGFNKFLYDTQIYPNQFINEKFIKSFFYKLKILYFIHLNNINIQIKIFFPDNKISGKINKFINELIRRIYFMNNIANLHNKKK